MATRGPERYELAALRWLVRLLLERRDLTLQRSPLPPPRWTCCGPRTAPLARSSGTSCGVSATVESAQEAGAANADASSLLDVAGADVLDAPAAGSALRVGEQDRRVDAREPTQPSQLRKGHSAVGPAAYGGVCCGCCLPTPAHHGGDRSRVPAACQSRTSVGRAACSLIRDARPPTSAKSLEGVHMRAAGLEPASALRPPSVLSARGRPVPLTPAR